VGFAAIWADDAIKQAHRANRRHWVKAGNGALIQKHHAPVNIVDGAHALKSYCYRPPSAQIPFRAAPGVSNGVKLVKNQRSKIDGLLGLTG
jgi:hypothetical protein